MPSRFEASVSRRTVSRQSVKLPVCSQLFNYSSSLFPMNWESLGMMECGNHWKSVDRAWCNLNSGSVGSARLSSEAIGIWASPKLDVATRFHAFSFWLRHGPSTLRQTKQSHGFCLNLFNTAFNEGAFGIFWPCSYPATKIHSHMNQKQGVPTQTDYSMHASASGGSWRWTPTAWNGVPQAQWIQGRYASLRWWQYFIEYIQCNCLPWLFLAH